LAATDGDSELNARYILVPENKNWTDAQLACELRHETKLVMIADEFDQLRLHTFLNQVPGLRDRHQHFICPVVQH